MKMITAKVCIIILTLSLLGGCDSNEKNERNYIAEINNWHRERVNELTQPDGWLSLAGLYWLKPGTNTFGSDSTNDIIFPAENAPPRIGQFVLKDSVITVLIKPGVPVMHKNEKVTRMQMRPDNKGNPIILHLGSLSWYIIKRSGQFAVRLKNSKNPALQTFNGIERFPVSKRWNVKAEFIPYDRPKTISVPTVVGKPTKATVPGVFTFTINEKTYRLQPLQFSENSDTFFIVFGDKTNGKQTYSGGRYVYVNNPGENNITYIDFNKAYNPPCAFTKFATCPLPPPQNRLPIAVTAGEKRYQSGAH